MSQKKRIVLVVPSFPKLSETFVVSQFAGLLERGWDVHIVCSTSEESEWQKFPKLAAQSEVRRRVHVRWPIKPRWLAGLLLPATFARSFLANPRGTTCYLLEGLRRWGIRAAEQFYLDANIIRLRPDLIHFEFGALAVKRMHLKPWIGAKILVSFRGYDLNFVGLEDPNFYHEIWEHADALHLLGEDLWRRAQRRGCPSNKPHFLIPPAIDTEFFDPGARSHVDICGNPDRPLRILGVGRLEWKKGYEWGLQAIQKLIEKGIHTEYRIIGDGASLEAVMFACHQMGLEDAVQWLGALPRTGVREQMQWADVFLHSAVSEGFCNAVLEAQSMALPVVCTDADGLPENVAHGGTGFVVPRRDPEAIAARLTQLAGDPTLRQRMGTAGRERVLSHFRISHQIDSFERMYRFILNSENPSHELES